MFYVCMLTRTWDLVFVRGVPAITEAVPAVTSGVPTITAGVSPSQTNYTIVFVSLLLVSSSFRNLSRVRKSSEFFLHKGKKKYRQPSTQDHV